MPASAVFVGRCELWLSAVDAFEVAMADSAASRCRAPVNAALARLVRAAEEAKKGSPRLSPEAGGGGAPAKRKPDVC